MLEVNDEVVKVITTLLAVSTGIFTIWALVLFRIKNEKWKDIAGIAAFSLLGTAITPLVHSVANDFSFLVRLGLSTIIMVSYVAYRYRQSKQI